MIDPLLNTEDVMPTTIYAKKKCKAIVDKGAKKEKIIYGGRKMA